MGNYEIGFDLAAVLAAAKDASAKVTNVRASVEKIILETDSELTSEEQAAVITRVINVTPKILDDNAARKGVESERSAAPSYPTQFIMTSPNGAQWKVGITDIGVLISTRM